MPHSLPVHALPHPRMAQNHPAHATGLDCNKSQNFVGLESKSSLVAASLQADTLGTEPSCSPHTAAWLALDDLLERLLILAASDSGAYQFVVHYMSHQQGNCRLGIHFAFFAYLPTIRKSPDGCSSLAKTHAPIISNP
jgi:hypothetical protein